MVGGVRETGHHLCGVVVEQIFCNAQIWTLETGKENIWIFKEAPQERICNQPNPVVIGLGLSEDHGHEKVMERSITGIMSVVKSTPVTWSSKRQAAIQTSTFGAELTALKKAVDEVATL
eukprot:220237-Ditylum_brightwellii.AAC.1